jgi:hypothetical protein
MMKRHLATLLFVVILPMAQFAFAGEDEGIAVVGRYIADTKHWKPIEYKIEKQCEEMGCTVYMVRFLADAKQPYPGGGESFEAYYDPSTRRVVKTTRFQ